MSWSGILEKLSFPSEGHQIVKHFMMKQKASKKYQMNDGGQ